MLRLRRPHRALRRSSSRERIRPSQVVVYTANFGGYDRLQPVESSGVDCICFTDDHTFSVRGWRTILHDAQNQPRRTARQIKILGHESLDSYEYSIWIDANLSLCVDPVVLVEAYMQSANVAAFKHPERICTYQEAEMVKYLNLDADCVVDEQIRRYREDGMPSELGLFETAVIVRKKTPSVAVLNKLWWSEIDRGSQRDQLSVMYAMWKVGNMGYAVIPGCRERSRLVAFGNHAKPATGTLSTREM